MRAHTLPLRCAAALAAPGKRRGEDECLEYAFWSTVTANPPLYGADTPLSLFDDKLEYGWVGGWAGGWVGGRVGGRAGERVGPLLGGWAAACRRCLVQKRACGPACA